MNIQFIERIEELKTRLSILNGRLTIGLEPSRISDLKVEIYDTEELLRLNQACCYNNINLWYGSDQIQ